MSEPMWCNIRQHYCRCHDFGKRCQDEDYCSDYDEPTTYCVCDSEPDEEERASGRCKSCGKPF